MPDNSLSLNKFISNTGRCSRREADKLIKEGRVTLNGKVAVLGNRVNPGDSVLIDNKSLQAKPRTLYIAFNKPVGIVCTTDEREKKSITRFINHPERLFPIGRLDKPSQGLIFLTNDGDIVNKILRAGNNHEKEYQVTVDQLITEQFIHKMESGVPILDTVTQPCQVTQTSENTFKIILTQGLNRQIRRMCEHLGYNVTRLKRTRIMHVKLSKIPPGKWRELTAREIKTLRHLIGDSSKTEEASAIPEQKKKEKKPLQKRVTPQKKVVPQKNATPRTEKEDPADFFEGKKPKWMVKKERNKKRHWRPGQ